MAQFTIPDRNKTKEMRYQMGYALADMANENERIVALDADLRSSTVAGSTRFPGPFSLTLSRPG